MKAPSLRFISSPPKDVSVRVYNSADQSIANAANTALTFDTEDWDTHAQHSISSNTNRLTCKVAGKYLISGCVRWNGHATGERSIIITKNAGQAQLAQFREFPGHANDIYSLISTIANLAVGDYVELVGFQSSGAALNSEASSNEAPVFSMAKLRG